MQLSWCGPRSRTGSPTGPAKCETLPSHLEMLQDRSVVLFETRELRQPYVHRELLTSCPLLH